jgi:hypothetical protein
VVVTNHTPEALYPRIVRGLLPKEHVCIFSFLVSKTCSPESSGSLTCTMVKGSVDTDTMYLMKYVLPKDAALSLRLQPVAFILQDPLTTQSTASC